MNVQNTRMPIAFTKLEKGEERKTKKQTIKKKPTSFSPQQWINRLGTHIVLSQQQNLELETFNIQ